MRTWIKNNWRWAALNGFALIVMLSLLLYTPKVSDLNPHSLPMVESGKWAIRFLLISLSITPFNTVFGWRSLIKLRKPAGLWAFGFGVAHFVFYLRDTGAIWLDYPIPDYIAGLGVIGLIILALLAATSTRWAMKQLGKWWKRLHRWVYAAGILVLIHGLLESSNKLVTSVDPQAGYEVMLYLVILIILLAARIPIVRSVLAQLRHRPVAADRKSG